MHVQQGWKDYVRCRNLCCLCRSLANIKPAILFCKVCWLRSRMCCAPLSNFRLSMSSGIVIWLKHKLHNQVHMSCSSCFWLCREHNKVADKLSNEAIDTVGWQGLKDNEVGFMSLVPHVTCTDCSLQCELRLMAVLLVSRQGLAA